MNDKLQSNLGDGNQRSERPATHPEAEMGRFFGIMGSVITIMLVACAFAATFKDNPNGTEVVAWIAAAVGWGMAASGCVEIGRLRAKVDAALGHSDDRTNASQDGGLT